MFTAKLRGWYIEFPYIFCPLPQALPPPLSTSFTRMVNFFFFFAIDEPTLTQHNQPLLFIL